MARPFTRAQALQNAAFLAALRRTGNARLAARELGVHRATYTKRRAKDAAFAADWDATLAIASARLSARDRHPSDPTEPPGPRPTRTRAGRLQRRAPRPCGLTPDAERCFLDTLSDTANIRLAARAAGFSHATFHVRARTDPGFAHAMRHARQHAAERIARAIQAGAETAGDADGDWHHDHVPPFAALTWSQAVRLLDRHRRRLRAQRERSRDDEAGSTDDAAFVRAAEDAAIYASLARYEAAAAAAPVPPGARSGAGLEQGRSGQVAAYPTEGGLIGGPTIADWEGWD